MMRGKAFFAAALTVFAALSMGSPARAEFISSTTPGTAYAVPLGQFYGSMAVTGPLLILPEHFTVPPAPPSSGIQGPYLLPSVELLLIDRLDPISWGGQLSNSDGSDLKDLAMAPDFLWTNLVPEPASLGLLGVGAVLFRPRAEKA